MYPKLVVYHLSRRDGYGQETVAVGNAKFDCKNFVPTLADIRAIESKIAKEHKFDNAIILNIIDLGEAEETEK